MELLAEAGSMRSLETTAAVGVPVPVSNPDDPKNFLDILAVFRTTRKGPQRGKSNETRDSPQVSAGPRALRLRRTMDDRLDEERASCRDLLKVPSLLHGQAEAARHRWPH